MKQTITLMGFLAWVLLLMGCATIVSKGTYNVSVNSFPQGADVTVKDKEGEQIYKGTTPCSLDLKSGAGYFRSASYSFHFEKKGYKGDAVVSAEIDPWYLGNLFWGSSGIILGMLIIDPLTGNMWKLDDTVICALSEVP